MKFQCGKCEKIYQITNTNALKRNLSFKCMNCHNKFLIKKDSTFSSSSKNSKVVCENCETFFSEENNSCVSCDPILSKTHEDLKIDNKFYELYDVNDKGKTYNRYTGKRIGGRNILLPVSTVIIVLIFSFSIYFFSKNSNASSSPLLSTIRKIFPANEKRNEIKVVITKSGQTYYVKEIENEGLHLKLYSKNGVMSKIKKEDVLQISKAVIEK